ELQGRVVVIGGGNTAIDVAREAVRLGADAHMVYRRTEEQMPAYPHEVEAARRDGVEFEWLANPRRYYGTDRVEGVQFIRMELGKPDESGRPTPEPVPGSEFVIEAHTVVKAIGQQSWWDLLSALDLEADGGRVQTDARQETSRPGFFAGGDCVNGGATVVEAVQDGKRAAKQIDYYLSGRPIVDVQGNGEAEQAQEQKEKGEEEVASLLRREEEEPIRRYYQGDQLVGVDRDACKGCDLCINSCPADILHLDDRDRIVVDDIGDCIFCGLCEARCPDFAIWVEHDGA
ncbi:MAG: FAD-dependent oxidoreductase, partial [Salinibacter sp.]